MLRVAVVSIFPEMLSALTQYGITGRAVESGLLKVLSFNPRDFSQDKHHRVDDRPYGGGPGMVMMVEPLCSAIRQAKEALPKSKVIYLSPQGKRLQQAEIAELAKQDEFIFVAGRYEGIDERIIEAEIDEEWSIGDYVLSGGELPVMVMIDAMARMIPGVLGHEGSAEEDSFSSGILDHPHYTRPEKVEERSVPEVLLQGNHEEIRSWRLKQALGRTWQRRPDLLENRELDKEQQTLLDEFIEQENE